MIDKYANIAEQKDQDINNANFTVTNMTKNVTSKPAEVKKNATNLEQTKSKPKTEASTTTPQPSKPQPKQSIAQAPSAPNEEQIVSEVQKAVEQKKKEKMDKIIE